MAPAHRTFALEYLTNGFNAAAAYSSAYPGVTRATACSNGHRLLKNADVRTFLAAELAARWETLKMSADEALARVSMIARADIRQLFNTKGELLPPHQWPEEAACFVRSVRRTADGYALAFVDRLGALRLILELCGKLRPSAVDSVDALAEAILVDRERRAAERAHREAQETAMSGRDTQEARR